MPSFTSAQVRLESGALYSSTMQVAPHVTNVRLGYNLPRANVMVIGRGKPLENRPVVNYTPVEASVDFYETNNSFRTMLGLVNSTGVTAAISESRAANATLGVRSMQVLFAPTTSANYNGVIDLKSGVLTSYSIQGSVGDPVRGNFGLQFLDMSGSVNTTARDTTNFATNLVKPEGMSLTGVQFTGCGLTGINMQSFNFTLGLSRSTTHQLGTKFPVERPLVDAGVTLQCQGWFDGINNSITGLNVFDCGAPMAGTVGLTLSPSCGGGSPTTITMQNPYLDSFNIEAQVGGFSTFSISLSLPIGPNALENTDGSVVTMT